MTWEKIMSELVGNQEQSVLGVPESGDLAGLGAIEDFSVPYPARVAQVEDCAYQNAATCPDCGGGMFRQGRCFFCPRCGFESCGI